MPRVGAAERGAKVVVNDLGDANGHSANADAVVAEIQAAGGEAIANGANVADFAQVEAMVKQAMDQWGRVDILINNAGILRDKTFAKMSMDDFRLVIDVHLMGSVYCTKAVWEIMREQQYGRIVFTTLKHRTVWKLRPVELWRGQNGDGRADEYAASGRCQIQHPCQLSGSNRWHGDDRWLAARRGLQIAVPGVGQPGGRLPGRPGRAQSKSAGAGGGSFAIYKGFETEGVNLLPDKLSADGVAAAWDAINDEKDMRELTGGFEQTGKFATKGAAKELGIKLTQ